jgi:REP element-mobilizing transposase RayT/CheY-like chemotaxis protein
MAIRVLIATPIDSLGQLIQQALQKDGLYQVDLVDSDDQALERAQTEPFDVAILDFDVTSDFVDLVANLRGHSPQAAFVAIPPENDAQPPDVDSTLVDAWVSLPFYLPDLLDVLEEILDKAEEGGAENAASPKTPRRDSSHPAPAWLQDVNRVAQHLTRLSLESAAPAALITRGSQLWAYAGQLPQLAADELARVVGRNWMRSDSDLAQFVRLETTGDEYMLYATTLGEDYVLALAFETETSFMEMRSQAGTLARQLSSLPQDERDSLEEGFVSEAAPAPQGKTVPELPSDWMPRHWQPGEDIDESSQDFLDELLSTIDFPTPEAEPAVEAIEESQPTEVAVEEQTRQEETPQAEEPALQAETSLPVETEAPVQGTPEQLAETRPTQVKEKLRPQKSFTVDKFALKSDSATLHNLTYACVLIPRLPQHHLVGRIATRLTEWMRQFSLAFGWRLEHISVRPAYLHWVAVVPPTASPGVMVDHIRRETSTRIFAEYPRLERENPSGEFWVSDYLVVNGRDAFTHDMVEEFIRHVRSRQGAL